ncbi:MAG: tetratricopeptide repeat protein [Acidobacteriota bacterium]
MLRLGPYRILRSLGRGGMGVVSLGVHEDTGERAAIKTVRIPAASMLLSIRREIRGLQRLSHPGVVRVLHEGVADGLPWYAMELLDGRTLREHVSCLGPAAVAGGESQATVAHARPVHPAGSEAEGGPSGWWTECLAQAAFVSDATLEMRPDDRLAPAAPVRTAGGGIALSMIAPVLRLVQRICAPLAYLHGEGIVHRDLKPDNILVRPDGFPVLVDFGLMTRFAAEGSRESIDGAASIAGTAAFMAPEQARGELVDARADVYSLGCVLYDLLTGRPPFLGETAFAVLWKHCSEPPAAPSSLVPGLPPEIDDLCARLLAKSPRDRLGHAEDVAAALAAIGAGAPEAWGPPARPYLYRPRLIGRDGPLKSVVSAIGELAGGRGGVALVAGESGSGKTRILMEAMSAALDLRLRVLVGQCDPPRGDAPAALRGLLGPLQSVVDRCRELGRETTERIFGSRGALLAIYEPSIATLPGQERAGIPQDLPPAAARLRLFVALSEIFEEVTREGPVLLVIDDLHWADDLTLGFLEHQARRSRPVLVLGGFRSDDEGAGARTLARLASEELASIVRLGALEEDSVVAIVDEMLALGGTSDTFVGRLARHGEGNPFYVAEYLRAALAAGLIGRERGRWRVLAADQMAPLPLPGTLRDLVLARLRSLPSRARRLVDACAVLGQEADTVLLAKVAGVGDDDILELTRDLLSRQVMEERAPGTFRLLHDRIREAAYQALDPAERAELHRDAACALESRDAPKSQPAVLGHHWELAGDGARARTYYLAGAQAARARHALEEAGGLYRSYLGLVAAPVAESAGARLALAQTLQDRGLTQDAVREHGLAAEDARAAGDREIEAKAIVGGAHALQLLGRPDEARPSYLLAMKIAGDEGLANLRATIVHDLAILERNVGNVAEARALVEDALETYRQLGDRRGEGIALGNLAVLVHSQGDVTGARDIYEAAIAIHGEVGNTRHEGLALSNLALVTQELGRPWQALVLYERALAFVREARMLTHEAYVLGNIAELHRQLGEHAKGREELDRAIAITRTTGELRYGAYLLAVRATAGFEQGDLDGVEEGLDEARALARSAKAEHPEAFVLTTLGRFLTRERPAEALRAFDEAERLFETIGDQRGRRRAVHHRGRLHLAHGRWAEAEESLRLALELCGPDDTAVEGRVLVSTARLVRLRGGPPDTAALERALACLTQIDDRLGLVECHCERGHAELCASRPASGALGRAEELARGLGLGASGEHMADVAALRRAIAAFDAGRTLVAGMAPEDAPPASTSAR